MSVHNKITIKREIEAANSEEDDVGIVSIKTEPEDVISVRNDNDSADSINIDVTLGNVLESLRQNREAPKVRIVTRVDYEKTQYVNKEVTSVSKTILTIREQYDNGRFPNTCDNIFNQMMQTLPAEDVIVMREAIQAFESQLSEMSGDDQMRDSPPTVSTAPNRPTKDKRYWTKRDYIRVYFSKPIKRRTKRRRSSKKIKKVTPNDENRPKPTTTHKRAEGKRKSTSSIVTRQSRKHPMALRSHTKYGF